MGLCLPAGRGVSVSARTRAVEDNWLGWVGVVADHERFAQSKCPRHPTRQPAKMRSCSDSTSREMLTLQIHVCFPDVFIWESEGSACTFAWCHFNHHRLANQHAGLGVQRRPFVCVHQLLLHIFHRAVQHTDGGNHRPARLRFVVQPSIARVRSPADFVSEYGCIYLKHYSEVSVLVCVRAFASVRASARPC